MKILIYISLILLSVFSYSQNATTDLAIKTNGNIAHTEFANGDYIGNIVVTNISRVPLKFKIISGNTIYSVFRFEQCKQEDQTGCLFINNAKGIYKADGTIRQDKFNLKVRVSNGNNYKDAIIIIFIMNYHQLIIRQNPIII